MSTPDNHIPMELLLEYMENELPDAQMQNIKLHIDQCPLCHSKIQNFQRTILTIESTTAPELDPQSWKQFTTQTLEKCIESAERRTTTASRNSLIWKFSMWLTGKNILIYSIPALASILIIIGVFLFTYNPPSLVPLRFQEQALINLSVDFSSISSRSQLIEKSFSYGFSPTDLQHEGFSIGYIMALLSYSIINDNQESASLLTPLLDKALTRARINVKLNQLSSHFKDTTTKWDGREYVLNSYSEYYLAIENELGNISKEQQLLFRAGFWLLTLSLSIDHNLLNHTIYPDVAMHTFEQALKTDIPPNAKKGFTTIVGILEKESVKTRDIQALKRAINEIELLLI